MNAQGHYCSGPRLIFDTGQRVRERLAATSIDQRGTGCIMELPWLLLKTGKTVCEGLVTRSGIDL